jgi:hypothetical protein
MQNQIAKILERGRMVLYPQQVQDLDTQEKHLPLDQYLRILVTHAQKLTLGRYSAIQTYLATPIHQRHAVNMHQVLLEQDALSYEVKRTLLRNRKDATNVLYCGRYAELMRKHIANQLSAKELETWEAEKDRFYTRMSELSRLLSWKDHIAEHSRELKAADIQMATFYRLATKRNEALVRNLLHTASPVKVMVLGGFHVPGITELLRSKGISYRVITPNINGSIDDRVYLRRLHEQAAYLNSAHLMPGLSSTQQPVRTTAIPASFLQHSLALMSALQTGEIAEAIVQQHEILQTAGISRSARLVFFRSMSRQYPQMQKEATVIIAQIEKEPASVLAGVSFLENLLINIIQKHPSERVSREIGKSSSVLIQTHLQETKMEITVKEQSTLIDIIRHAWGKERISNSSSSSSST